jgi:hypothetical protein
VRLGSIFIWICSIGSVCTAQSPVADFPSPMWSAEVLQEEFTPIQNPLTAIVTQRDHPGVIFLDGREILVYEVNSTGKLSSRESSDVSH